MIVDVVPGPIIIGILAIILFLLIGAIASILLVIKLITRKAKTKVNGEETQKIILIWKSNGLDLFILSFIPTLGLEGIIFFLFQYRERLFWENISLYQYCQQYFTKSNSLISSRVTLTKVPDYCYIFPLEIAYFGEWKNISFIFSKQKIVFAYSTSKCFFICDRIINIRLIGERENIFPSFIAK